MSAARARLPQLPRAPVVARRRQALLQAQHLDELGRDAQHLVRRAAAEALHKQRSETLRLHATHERRQRTRRRRAGRALVSCESESAWK